MMGDVLIPSHKKLPNNSRGMECMKFSNVSGYPTAEFWKMPLYKEILKKILNCF
jgi:hypothetical protein